MFAEDVGLIPKGSFTEPARRLRRRPGRSSCPAWSAACGATWTAAAFPPWCAPRCRASTASCSRIPDVVAADREQIGMLLEAAKADWTQVEPAIFGTLLERALDPRERHALGAHYTPRAYVDRLVQPTVIEPLRQSWAYVQGAAVLLANEGKQKGSRRRNPRLPSPPVPCACSTPPAAAAIFFTSRWNT
jgi:hypothetical protein